MFSFFKKWKMQLEEGKRELNRISDIFGNVKKLSVDEARQRVLPLLSESDLFACLPATDNEKLPELNIAQSVKEILETYSSLSINQIELSRSYIAPYEYLPEFTVIGEHSLEKICVLLNADEIYIEPTQIGESEITYNSIYHMLLIEYLTEPSVMDTV